MGWKNIKEHYGITHIVRVTKEGICIGSPYIHDIIVIRLDGTLAKRYDRDSNDDLARYQREMESNQEKLKQLINTPDLFTRSVVVYTYEGGEILEKVCEEPGWPNVTHDGEIMHDNTFSVDKATVVAWAKRNAEIGMKWARERIQSAEKDLKEARMFLATEQAHYNRLASDYQTIQAGP